MPRRCHADVAALVFITRVAFMMRLISLFTPLLPHAEDMRRLRAAPCFADTRAV